MKFVETINNEEGIYYMEFESHDDAKAFIKMIKEDYPFAILHGTGYRSKTYILNLHANWGEFVDTLENEDGTFTCIHCTGCEKGKERPSRYSSPGVGSDPERCFHEQFWADVIQGRHRHFIKNGSAYSFTNGEGGFSNRRYTIEFEDGETLRNMSLWHRGEVPECIQHLLRKATTKIE